MDNGYIYEYRLVILNSHFLNASTNETESLFISFGENTNRNGQHKRILFICL